MVEIGGRFVAEIAMEICGFVSGFFGSWVSFSDFMGLKFVGLFMGFLNLWVSFLNFFGFEIYVFVFGFDICTKGLIFHVMFWVCWRLMVGFGFVFLFFVF